MPRQFSCSLTVTTAENGPLVPPPVIEKLSTGVLRDGSQPLPKSPATTMASTRLAVQFRNAAT